MATQAPLFSQFTGIPGLRIRENAPLSEYTRFGIGGPADVLAETANAPAFVDALLWLRAHAVPHVVIGAGTNLVVSDNGFRGVVLRFTAQRIKREENTVFCDAGADLMALVNFTIDEGLQGIHTLMGIPGSVGAAIYGNAGAYGHAIAEVIRTVRFFDGCGIRTMSGEECRFQYRESIFKQQKAWIIFCAEMEFQPGDQAALRKQAEEILAVRNEKFPPTMRCAGSIFKNLRAAELPARVTKQVPSTVIREGKIPAAWFLEQVGAKDSWEGKIHVAPYHANLVYNTGGATAEELCRMIRRLKSAVRQQFEIELEEEVQYVGFPANESKPAA